MGIKQYIDDRKKTIKDDLIAGLIVAIVAFPLAIGFAIASGVDPSMGLITAIVAGFLAALFGGSEFQISGPTGAMVVVILSVTAQLGVDGLIIATFIAGIILILLGLLRLGKIIEYMPSPVIVGFTAGIAFIIFFGQLNNFFGVSPTYAQGADFIHKTIVSLQHIPDATIAAVILALLTILILAFMPKINKRIPGSIVAVIITTALAFFFPAFFAIKKVGDIGNIPHSLPLPHIPEITWTIIIHVLPAALTIAALAAIESLLSAVVADGLTDTKHKPNKELIGQGIANIGVALFGGLPATGAIARTATNIRNGGKSRLVGMLHAIFLLLFVVAIGAIATKIPLPTIAGILMFVAFNMVEWERVRLILKTPHSDIAVMIVTFLVTILIDLTAAIEIGLVLAALLFMKRMSDLYKVEEYEANKDQNEIVKKFQHKDISIYTINGPLFFGAASRFDQTVAATPGGHKPIKIIRMKYVPVIDATGLNFMESTAHKHHKMKGIVLFSSVHPDVMKIIKKAGLHKKIGEEHFFPTTKAAIVHALKHAHRMRGEAEIVTAEELEKYNLTELDAEEKISVAETKDIDPVEEMFDSMGITKLQDFGMKSFQKVQAVGEEGIKTFTKKKKK